VNTKIDLKGRVWMRDDGHLVVTVDCVDTAVYRMKEEHLRRILEDAVADRWPANAECRDRFGVKVLTESTPLERMEPSEIGEPTRIGVVLW
jgi:acylphosphatase